MKALTLWQPWASLVAYGIKSIETRSWSTSYRGPLAIHAAKRPAVDGECVGRVQPDGLGNPMFWPPKPFTEDEQVARGQQPDGDLHAFPLPLGAIVATCVLADVVPMVEPVGHGVPKSLIVAEVIDGDPRDLILLNREDRWWKNESDQRPYGDFAPGRFAWLLADIKATYQRCPACLGEGCACDTPTPHVGTAGPCSACDAAGTCPPIPARGRQGLWEWAP